MAFRCQYFLKGYFEFYYKLISKITLDLAKLPLDREVMFAEYSFWPQSSQPPALLWLLCPSEPPALRCESRVSRLR